MSDRPGADAGLGALLERVPQVLRGSSAYHVPRPAHVRAKLDANELPFALPGPLRRRLADALAEVELERYPDAAATTLRELLARRHGVDGAQLVFGNGSDELIGLLCDALAAPRSGGRPAAIAYPVPTFVYYRLATVARGLCPVEIPLAPGFQLDVDAVVAALEREDPAVLFLALPNNPTGTLWPHELAVELARSFPRTAVVSDEAYLPYSGVTNLPALATTPNLIVLRTLSKIGMAGLRVGYLMAAPALTALIEKVRPPYNLSSLSQAAAEFLLTEAQSWCDDRAAEVVAARAALASQLERRGFEVFPSEANLLLLRTAPGRAHGIWRALQDRGVLVRDFDRPGALAGCLRVTIGTPEDHAVLLSTLDEVLAHAP